MTSKHRIPYRYSDGGRKAAGFDDKRAGDCTTRAIAIVTRKPYADVWNAITDYYRVDPDDPFYSFVKEQHTADDGITIPRHRNGFDYDHGPCDKVMAIFGLTRVDDYNSSDYKFIRVHYTHRRTRFANPSPFVDIYARYGDCVAVTDNHAFAIKDGAVRDTWDSRYYMGKMFYNVPDAIYVRSGRRVSRKWIA